MKEKRTEYLKGLSEDYGIDELIVFELADILGEIEDYDGLVNELNDFFY